jgi:hypothetical protein
MSQPALLCTYCSQIPLDPDTLCALPDVKSRTFSLGTVSRLSQSQCPFCHIASRVLAQCRNEWADDQVITLEWHEGPFVPGRRSAFRLAPLHNAWVGFAQDRESKQPERVCYLLPSPPSLNISRVLRWISDCEWNHSKQCKPPAATVSLAEAFQGLSVLRLIDVQSRCIVEEASDLVKYVALSYVWGAVPNFRLTKANRRKLMTPSSLAGSVWPTLPETIKDAITLVRKLGCRYLWVDALCLLQNDADDLNQGVNVMDLIYERAWFTIVAACGHDASAGLPGVREGSRAASENVVEIKPAVSLGIVSGLDSYFRRSVYDTRAWT